MTTTPKFLLSLSLLVSASAFAMDVKENIENPAEEIVAEAIIADAQPSKFERINQFAKNQVSKMQAQYAAHPTAGKAIVGAGVFAGLTGAAIAAYKKYPAVSTRVNTAATWVRDNAVLAKDWSMGKLSTAKNWSVDKATAGKAWVGAKVSSLDEKKFSKADAAALLGTIFLGKFIYNNLPQKETVTGKLSSAKTTLLNKFGIAKTAVTVNASAFGSWFVSKAKSVAQHEKVQDATSWVKSNPKKTAAIAATPVVVGGGLFAGYKFYKNYKAKQAAAKVQAEVTK